MLDLDARMICPGGGRFSGDADPSRLTIEDLEVKRLKVTELEVAGERRPPV